MKDDEMDETCSVHREKRSAHKILLGNPEGERPFERPSHR
jgi:hypothetical protein